MRKLRKPMSAGMVHGILLAYTLLALWPIFLVIANSFKTRKAIFRDPLALPSPDTFSLIGFEKVLGKSSFGLYLYNSLSVTIITLAIVLLIGAMAAWALSEYRFKGKYPARPLYGDRDHGADPVGFGFDPAADCGSGADQYADRIGAGLCGAKPATGNLHSVRIHEADSK